MDKPLNILMLNYEYPPIGGGGGNAHRHLLTEYARQNNLHIDVLTSSAQPGHSTESFSENITIHKIGIHKKSLHYWRKTEVLEWLFKANRKLKTMLAENQYDLAHAFFGFPTGWLTYRHRHKLPYIISLRGSDVPGFNVRLKLDYHLLKGLFRKIWQKADAVIANSKGLAELAKKFEPTLDIGIICNGIDTERFSPPQERTLTGRIRLLTVCRLIARKRIHLLIEAVALLHQQSIDVELNIAGEGNLMDELQAHAKRLNIADRINFLGRVSGEQMPSVYQQNHVFVMSSAHEGMSNAMLEAMACGLPIITTPCEGTQELVNDNGIIVDRPEPETIAKAICNLLRDSTTYDSMSDASRKVAQAFTWRESARQYIDLYLQVVQNQK